MHTDQIQAHSSTKQKEPNLRGYHVYNAQMHTAQIQHRHTGSPISQDAYLVSAAKIDDWQDFSYGASEGQRVGVGRDDAGRGHIVHAHVVSLCADVHFLTASNLCAQSRDSTCNLAVSRA
jgi:hypothetical protein